MDSTVVGTKFKRLLGSQIFDRNNVCMQYDILYNVGYAKFSSLNFSTE